MKIGTMFAHIGLMTGQWARVLPFTAAPELEAVLETPADSESEDSRSFAVGDRVRVKNYDWQDWKTGYITYVGDRDWKVEGSVVEARVMGNDKGYTWKFMEKFPSAAPAAAPPARGGQDLPLPDAPRFYLGQRVRVMDDPRGFMAHKAGFISRWTEGEVVSVDGPKVLIDGYQTAYKFGIVEPLSRAAVVVKPQPKAGQRVQCRDRTDENWSYGIADMRLGGTTAFVIVNGVRLETAQRKQRAGLEYREAEVYGNDYRIVELIALNVGDLCEFKKATSIYWKPCKVTAFNNGDYTITAEPLVGRWEMTSPSYIVGERITLDKRNTYELEPVTAEPRVY